MKQINTYHISTKRSYAVSPPTPHTLTGETSLLFILGHYAPDEQEFKPSYHVEDIGNGVIRIEFSHHKVPNRWIVEGDITRFCG